MIRPAIAIGMASAALIAFQLIVMQILSVAQWQYFAWMVISIAMLGFGAAGTALFVARRYLIEHYKAAMPFLVAATAATVLTAAAFSGATGTFDPFLLFFEWRQIGLLVQTYLVFALPFFLGGMAITLLFYRHVGHVPSLYFANLVGSGVGAGLVLLLLHLLPLTYLPIVPAALLLCSALLFLERPYPRAALLMLGIAAVMTIGALIRPPHGQPSQYKDISAALDLPGAGIVHRSTTPYGQLEVVRADALRYAPGLSLHFGGEAPALDVAFNNGTYLGTIPPSGDMPVTTGMEILDYSTRVLPYRARYPVRVLVLSATTGENAAHALHNNATTVTAVEPNRALLGALLDETKPWSPGVFDDPRVSVIPRTIRRFLSDARDQRYDLIVTPTIGEFGGTSGVYAMQERYDLTVDAFRAMVPHLAPDGMIATSIWLEDPPRPLLRILSTMRAVLLEQGFRDPADHIVAIRGWNTATVVMSTTPFTAAESDRVRAAAADLGFDPLILPDIRPHERAQNNIPADPHFFDRIDAILEGRSGDNLPGGNWFRSDPVRDGSPYFFQFLRPEALFELRDVFGAPFLPYLELSFFLAIAAAVQAVVAAGLLILLPLAHSRWPRGARRWTLLFFSGTGAGYLLFEIILIQRLVLFLGQPVYATAAVLATLLISSGAGSYFSPRLAAGHSRFLAVSGFTCAILIIGTGLALPPLTAATMAAPGWIRASVSILMISPAGFVMGMMFPLGLTALARDRENHIPWACAIDSCLGVSVTAPAVLLAARAGFGVVTAVAAGAYLLTAAAALRIGS